jgi:hypothetical protein
MKMLLIPFLKLGVGYAWVLAGKIYQIGLPSSIFPILGDFVNKNLYE